MFHIVLPFQKSLSPSYYSSEIKLATHAVASMIFARVPWTWF